jgi:hypothetical protein
MRSRLIEGKNRRDRRLNIRWVDLVKAELLQVVELEMTQSHPLAVYDDAVEAVVDEDQQVAEQLGEQVHGKPRTSR